jgi:hypothetical protein
LESTDDDGIENERRVLGPKGRDVVDDDVVGHR